MGEADLLKPFAELVAKMRAAQTAYFKSRSSQSLDEARQLERAVDKWLERHGVQQTLFQTEDVP